jgi:hypothetical protein
MTLIKKFRDYLRVEGLVPRGGARAYIKSLVKMVLSCMAISSLRTFAKNQAVF